MGNIKRILGDNIRRYRMNKGWTQVYVADCLQITSPYLAQIESGHRGSSLELIESVAELFEIPIASLFIEDNSDKNSNKLRQVEISTIEKQLQENVIDNITKAFARLK